MTRLTSRSDGRGRPLSAVISVWAAGNPKIRRVWLSACPEDSDPRDEDISLMLELQPVADSEETLATWMVHCERWRDELRTQLGLLARSISALAARRAYET
jgi:hypothetical protein